MRASLGSCQTKYGG